MVLSIIVLLVVWSWQLTPLWVNIVISCICGLYLYFKCILFGLKFISISNEEDNSEDGGKL